jgi:RNA recognition motif-containing protein
MSKRLYVGNIPYQTTEAELRSLFENGGGQVSDVKIVLDRDSGRPRGFAFVEMTSDDEASAAIESLHGKAFGGRPLTVSEARERQSR